MVSRLPFSVITVGVYQVAWCGWQARLATSAITLGKCQ